MKPSSSTKSLLCLNITVPSTTTAPGPGSSHLGPTLLSDSTNPIAIPHRTWFVRRHLASRPARVCVWGSSVCAAPPPRGEVSDPSGAESMFDFPRVTPSGSAAADATVVEDAAVQAAEVGTEVTDLAGEGNDSGGSGFAHVPVVRAESSAVLTAASPVSCAGRPARVAWVLARMSTAAAAAAGAQRSKHHHTVGRTDMQCEHTRVATVARAVTVAAVAFGLCQERSVAGGSTAHG